MKPILYTKKEVADCLKVSVNTINYWVSRREIPFIRVGRHVRFDLYEVLEAFRRRTSTVEVCLTGLPGLSKDSRGSLKTEKEALLFSGKEKSNGN